MVAYNPAWKESTALWVLQSSPDIGFGGLGEGFTHRKSPCISVCERAASEVKTAILFKDLF